MEKHSERKLTEENFQRVLGLSTLTKMEKELVQ